MATTVPIAKPSRPRPSWRRRLLRWAVILCCVYVLLVLLLVVLEDRFVYFPGVASDSSTPPPGVAVEDVELESADGTSIHAWWIPVAGARTTILFCHGQAGNVAHWAPVSVRMQQALTASALIFDYPGYGRSGGKPSEAGCYAAIDAAYDWLVEKQKIPHEEIVLVGVSLGGGVATDLAARRPHRALVLCMTFTSLPDVAQRLFPFAPTHWLMRNRFDNLAKIERCRGAVFIAHGSEDGTIPPSHAERLFAAAPAPRRLFVMEGVGHGSPIFSGESLDQLRLFLRNH